MEANDALLFLRELFDAGCDVAAIESDGRWRIHATRYGEGEPRLDSELGILTPA